MMENETTASQPKSIGDDAQFRELLLNWKFAYSQEKADIAYRKAIEHLESRTPAAQASATIQAAPDDAQILKIAAEQDYGDEDPKCIIRLARALFAATIQEPVMVAEQFNGEVLGRVTTYLSQFPEFQPHGDNSVQQAFENIIECIERLRAAPMVTDPAGVANQGAYGYKGCDIPPSGWYCTRTPGHEGPCAAWPCDEPSAQLAATIKAVPSEALTDAQRERIRDGLSIALGGAMDCTRVWYAWGIGTMSEDDFQLLADNDERLDELVDAVAANFAAPLADKTGGAQ